MASKGIKFKDSNNNAIYPCPYYPVGSIYISVNNVNPSQYFGGTWAAFATGRTLVGIDTSQTDFNTVKKTGGETTHTLSVDEMPSHDHSTDGSYIYAGSGNTAKTWLSWGSGSAKVQATGGGKAHNNLQPYITVYMWERTA